MIRLSKEHASLRVIKGPSSCSEADNLNRFCFLATGSDVTVVSDGDRGIEEMVVVTVGMLAHFLS